MEIELEKWYRCNVDKEILKDLSERSNIKGLIHVSIFFGLLLITGYLAYYTWGTWWSLLWLLVYGNVYCFSNAIWHEISHKTAFKSKFLNEFFYYISSFMSYFEPIRWRFTHFAHHGNTYSAQNPYDHEIEYGNDLKKTLNRLIINIIPFGELLFFKNSIALEIIRHAIGIKTQVMIDSIPENARSKCILISRIYVTIWFLIILWSLSVTSWLPVLYFVLPQFYGRTLHKIVSFTQHAGLARDIKDHRISSREMYLNSILSFLYWKMEYHIVHHLFPTIPSYNLEKLHYHLKDQLPKTNKGLIDAYKEIIPALLKQKEDSGYHIKIALPETQNI